MQWVPISFYRLSVIGSIICCLSAVSVRAIAQPKGYQLDDPAQVAMVAFAGTDLSQKAGPLVKVGFDLAMLSEEHKLHPVRRFNVQFQSANLLLPIVGDSVVVDVVAARDGAVTQSELKSIGMNVQGRVGLIVSGLLPIGAIDALASLTSVRFAQPAYCATNSGSTNTQGDQSMGSNIVRNSFALNGAGITVGVLSNSYNTNGGAPGDVTSGDLPGTGNPNGLTTPVNVLADLGAPPPSNVDEGRAMLQIIHDVAPGAALAFATANGGQATFATNIGNLRTTAGAQVIVDDEIYFAEPMFQDGVIAQAVDASVAAGVSYFSAAGNQARAGYQSAFVPGGVFASGSIAAATGAPAFMGGTAHDFDPGATIDNFQSITIPAGSAATPMVLTVSMQWNQPFFSISGAPGSASDLDIYLLNAAGTLVLAGAINANVGNDATEVLQFSNTATAPLACNLMIVQRSGPVPSQIKYVIYNGGINEWATNSGTIFGHANANGAEAVGAAPYFNTPAFGVSPPTLESFSSSGTTPILFTTVGVATNDARAHKPGITAPDGGNTTFFGTDIFQDVDLFPNFFGTSAAAPHAAAVAALMLQANPTVTPSQIYAGLEASAIDMDVPGFDNNSGAGLIQAFGAVQAVSPCVMTCPANIIKSNDPNQCGATISYSAPTSTGTCGAVACNPPSGSFFSVGTTSVKCRSGANTSCSFAVTVNDVQPPVISCPSDIVVNNDPGLCSAVVKFSVTATDNCPGVTLSSIPPSGSEFPVGKTTVNCKATDGSGNVATCSFIVTVIDNEPPKIAVTVEPKALWPPNHKLWDIAATVIVTDNCPGVTFVLTSITSNESDNGLGDGNTVNDIQGATLGTADLAFALRSERSGKGDGRTYTIMYKATDAHGNSASAKATVDVPHNQPMTFDPGPGVAELQRPGVFTLAQNFPNPFNPTTRILFELPSHSRVSLIVYNSLGTEIRRLADDVRLPGSFEILWDGLNDEGISVSSGLYFYKLMATPVEGGASFVKVMKAVMLK